MVTSLGQKNLDRKEVSALATSSKDKIKWYQALNEHLVFYYFQRVTNLAELQHSSKTFIITKFFCGMNGNLPF